MNSNKGKDYVFIKEFKATGPLRLAIKDNIDLKGEITTAGSRALAAMLRPAESSAACLNSAIRKQVAIVGKTNLNELAFGISGINPFYGTPVNPVDPELIPGGSSSGSAVGVAIGAFDIALGTDTGGSNRIPAACCGICGLKTTYGRLPLAGIYPLSPSLDTVGPLAKTVDGLILAMELLEPGFKTKNPNVQRLGLYFGSCLSSIKQSILNVINELGIDTLSIDLEIYGEVNEACLKIMHYEAWQTNKLLYENYADQLSDETKVRLEKGQALTEEEIEISKKTASTWKMYLHELFTKIDFLITPTLGIYPPTLASYNRLRFSSARFTLGANLAGVPAVSLPLSDPYPLGLQIIAGENKEEELLYFAQIIEEATLNSNK
jgi:amidase